MELDAPRLDFPGIIAQAPGFISFSLQDIRAPLALLPELGTLGRSCCAVHPQCPGVCWTHSLSWGSLLKAIEASKILSPHELHGLLALRICRRLLSPASRKSHARTAVFPAVFFFSLTSFFPFPSLPFFRLWGSELYRIASSQGHCSQLTREEWAGRSALPMSQEDVISSRLAEHTSSRLAEHTMSVIPIFPFLLSQPALISPHAAQCQNGTVPLQAVKPCALRSFNVKTRKVGNFGETEVKTRSCGRQNYFSSLLPPNLNPA